MNSDKKSYLDRDRCLDTRRIRRPYDCTSSHRDRFIWFSRLQFSEFSEHQRLLEMLEMTRRTIVINKSNTGTLSLYIKISQIRPTNLGPSFICSHVDRASGLKASPENSTFPAITSPRSWGGRDIGHACIESVYPWLRSTNKGSCASQ